MKSLIVILYSAYTEKVIKTCSNTAYGVVPAREESEYEVIGLRRFHSTLSSH